MDCYSFQPRVSLLDIQMPYDSQSYSKTISFLTINQGDICMILGYRFLRKLSVWQAMCGCVWLHGAKEKGREAKKKNERTERRKKKKQINWVNKVIFFVSWIIKIMQTMGFFFLKKCDIKIVQRNCAHSDESDLCRLKCKVLWFFSMKDLKHLKLGFFPNFYFVLTNIQ